MKNVGSTLIAHTSKELLKNYIGGVFYGKSRKLYVGWIASTCKRKGHKKCVQTKKEELIEYLTNIQGETTSQSEEEVSTEIPKKEENVDNNTGYKVTNEEDEIVEGILEVLPDGYGFLRGENYLSTPKDVYISPIQIRRFKLDKGDKIKGIARLPKEGENFQPLYM